MGIKKLWQLLDLFAEPTSLQEWRGKRVAIDASVWVSQFRSVTFSNKGASAVAGPGMSDEEIVKVLEGFLMRIIKLWSYEITPVFVFDGPAPFVKQREQERRANLRRKLEEGKLSRIALHVLRAQVGAGNEANLKKAVAWAEKQGKSHRSPHAKKRNSADNDNANSSDDVSSSESDDSIDEEAAARIIARARRIRQRSKAAALAADKCAQNAPVPVAALNAATNSFLQVEGQRHIERQERDVAHKGNTLLRHTSSAISSAYLGSRSAFESATQNSTNPGSQKEGRSPLGNDTFFVEADLGKIPQKSQETKALMVKQVNTQSASNSQKRRAPSITVIDSSEPTPQKVPPPLKPLIDLDDLPRPTNLLEEIVVSDDESNGIENFYPAPSRLEVGVAPILPQDLSLHLPTDLTDLEQMLNILGVAFVISPSESDQQCAYLCSPEIKVVDAVLTEDSDIVARGAACVLRGFFSTNAEHVKAYRQSVLSQQGITTDVMKGLAMLLGCDYCEGIKGLGIKGALRLIATLWPVDARQKSTIGTVWTLLEDFQVLQECQLRGTKNDFMLSEDRHSLQQHQLAQKWFNAKPGRTPDRFPDLEALKAFYNAPVRHFPKELVQNSRSDAIFTDENLQTNLAHFLLLRGLPDFALRKIQQLFHHKQEAARSKSREAVITDFFQRTSSSKNPKFVIPDNKFMTELAFVKIAVTGKVDSQTA